MAAASNKRHARLQVQFAELNAEADRWLYSPVTGVRLRRGAEGKLEVQMRGDAATCHALPEE